MIYALIWLGIGVLLSAGVAAYAATKRKGLYFEPKRTALVFFVLIPFGWPYIVYLIAKDLISKKF